MPIVEKTVYIAHGEQFDTREKAVAHCMDRIGEFLNKPMNAAMMSPRQKLVFVETVFGDLKSRRALIKLLDF